MAEINPYAPPAADLDPPPAGADAAPAFKLYTPGHATLATFLGTPAAGLYLIAANRRRLGRVQAANTTLVVGFVVSAILLAAAFLLPDSVGRVIPFASMFGVYHYAKQDAALLDAHLGRGGKKESGWKAAGIGVLGMVVVVGAAACVVLVAG